MIEGAAEKLTAMEERMNQLLAEIQSIDAQLGLTVKLGPDGKPVDYATYRDWRSRANAAKAGKLREFREVKEQVKRARAQAGSEELARRANLLNPRDTEEIALALLRILVRLHDAGTFLSQREWDTIRVAEDYFRHRGM